MGDKLDDHLTKALAEAEESSAKSSVPVIVTLRPDTDASSLKAEGLDIEHAFESISAVSGKIRLADLDRLEALDQVEKIEFDSQMHALNT
jgi:hypothetical protein